MTYALEFSAMVAHAAAAVAFNDLVDAEADFDATNWWDGGKLDAQDADAVALALAQEAMRQKLTGEALFRTAVYAGYTKGDWHDLPPAQVLAYGVFAHTLDGTHALYSAAHPEKPVPLKGGKVVKSETIFEDLDDASALEDWGTFTPVQEEKKAEPTPLLDAAIVAEPEPELLEARQQLVDLIAGHAVK